MCLSKLKKLKTLDMSHNFFNDQSIYNLLNFHLPKLEKITANDNPVESIHDDILDDIHKLRQYFQALEFYGERLFPQVRAMLIGEPEAGKSTLFELLQTKKVTLSHREATHGVNRVQLPFKNINHSDLPDDDKTVTLDLWDIGGQKPQHMCHRWFFRPGMMYIFVLRHDTDEEQVRYWLDMLRYQTRVYAGGHSQKPIIIPFFNKTVGTDEKPNDDLWGSIVSDYKHHFDLYREVIRFSGANSQQDELIPKMLSRLNEVIESKLEAYNFQKHLALMDILAEIFSNWDENYYTWDAFRSGLERNAKFQEEYQKFSDHVKQQADTQSPTRTEFLEQIVSYIDHAGTMIGFHTGDNRNKPDLRSDDKDQRPEGTYRRPDFLVKKEEWINRGVYALFPPEDALEQEATKSFREAMSTPNEDGIVGLCNRHQLEALLDGQEDTIDDHDGLITLLSLPKIGLMTKIGLTPEIVEDRYFIPSYMDFDERFKVEALEQDLQKAFQTAKFCHVLKADYWPPYFIYRLMVWITGQKHKKYPFSLDLTHTRKNAFRIRCDHQNPEGNEPYIDVIDYGGQLWCFAYSKAAGDLEKQTLPDYLKDLKNTVSQVYTPLVPTLAIERYIPCPHCIDVICKAERDQLEKELTLKNGDGLTAYKDVYRRGKEIVLKSNGQPTTEYKFYFHMFDRLESFETGLSLQEALTIISLFLYHFGLAGKTGKRKTPMLDRYRVSENHKWHASLSVDGLERLWTEEGFDITKSGHSEVTFGCALLRRFHEELTVIHGRQIPGEKELDDLTVLSPDQIQYLRVTAFNIKEQIQDCVDRLRSKGIIGKRTDPFLDPYSSTRKNHGLFPLKEGKAFLWLHEYTEKWKQSQN